MDRGTWRSDASHENATLVAFFQFPTFYFYLFVSGRLYPCSWHTSINWCLDCSCKAAFIPNTYTFYLNCMLKFYSILLSSWMLYYLFLSFLIHSWLFFNRLELISWPFYTYLAYFFAPFDMLFIHFQKKSQFKPGKGTISSKKLVTRLEKGGLCFFKGEKRTFSFCFFLSFILLDNVQKD